MGYFPFFVELSEKPGLIVGGGHVAARKIEKLTPYGPRLTVVAPEIREEIRRTPGLRLLERAVSPADLAGWAFAVAATDDPAVNRRVAAACRTAGIPVNVADDAESSSFLFPSVVKRGELSVGVCTGGGSPTAAIYLRERIEALLPERFEEILDFLQGCRGTVKAGLSQEACRKRLFAELFQACMERGAPLDEQDVERRIAAAKKGNGERR